MKVAALVAACVALAGCATPRTADEELAHRLIGKWSRVVDLAAGRIEEATEHSPDGKLRVIGVLHTPKDSIKYSASGSWHVQDGYYWYKIDSSDYPGWRPHGSEVPQKIALVSEWEWVMIRNESGAETRYWRFPK